MHTECALPGPCAYGAMPGYRRCIVQSQQSLGAEMLATSMDSYTGVSPQLVKFVPRENVRTDSETDRLLEPTRVPPTRRVTKLISPTTDLPSYLVLSG
jgi:hypothetical protein